jgi:transcriptional regulator with XRE-family HTH domain
MCNNSVYLCRMMITERIQAIIRHQGLTASAFADKLGVQRSGMSHIFSGRNKPSLDLVIKIMDAFPEISVDWLLRGEGEMQNDAFKQEVTNVTNLFDEPEVKSVQKEENPIGIIVTDDALQDDTSVNIPKSEDIQPSAIEELAPDQMMLIYPDGTFERFVMRSK